MRYNTIFNSENIYLWSLKYTSEIAILCCLINKNYVMTSLIAYKFFETTCIYLILYCLLFPNTFRKNGLCRKYWSNIFKNISLSKHDFIILYINFTFKFEFKVHETISNTWYFLADFFLGNTWFTYIYYTFVWCHIRIHTVEVLYILKISESLSYMYLCKSIWHDRISIEYRL